MAKMQTITGQLVELPVVDPKTIKPADIAHHLALINRFSGATREPVSVARHSLLCVELTKDPELKLPALLHDAPEAYMGDITSPVMESCHGPGLRHFKRAAHSNIYEALGLEPAVLFCYQELRDLDMLALSTERHAFMVSADWEIDLPTPAKATWQPPDWYAERENFARCWCKLDRSLDFHRDFYLPWVQAGAVRPRNNSLVTAP